MGWLVQLSEILESMNGMLMGKNLSVVVATGAGGGFWLAGGSSGSGTPPVATPSALRGGSLGGDGARLCTRAESIPIVGPSLTAQVVSTLIAVFYMQYCSHADVSEKTEH